MWQVELQRTGGGAIADENIDLKIFHRRVEDLFDHGTQAVNLVDEQNITGFHVRQHSYKLRRAFEHRTGGRFDRHTHLSCDDVRKRCLAEPGWSEYQRVIECL